MSQVPLSNISPGVRLAGTNNGQEVWVEIPGGALLAQLESKLGGTFATCGVMPDMLRVALIAWTAANGKPEMTAQVSNGNGYTLPVPVVRRTGCGNLQILSEPGTVAVLAKVVPPAHIGMLTVLELQCYR